VNSQPKSKVYATLDGMLADSVKKDVPHDCAKLLLLVMTPKGVQIQSALVNREVLLDTSGNEGTGDDFAMAVLAHLYSTCKEII
jgi:hypothetical protein